MSISGFFLKRRVEKQAKRSSERARIYGVDPEKNKKYQEERRKQMFMKEQAEERKAEERRIKLRATRGERFKKGLKAGLKKQHAKIKAKRKKNKGLYTKPSLGLGGNNPTDIKVNKKLW